MDKEFEFVDQFEVQNNNNNTNNNIVNSLSPPVQVVETTLSSNLTEEQLIQNVFVVASDNKAKST